MKPVIALDVDGVLNAGGSPEDLGKGWQLHRVEVPAEHVPPSPLIGGGGGHQKALTVNIDPGLHGRWINELSETVDFAWETTWEDAANYALVPLLGIAELPVATAVKRTRPRFGDTVIEWKARIRGAACVKARCAKSSAGWRASRSPESPTLWSAPSGVSPSAPRPGSYPGGPPRCHGPASGRSRSSQSGRRPPGVRHRR